MPGEERFALVRKLLEQNGWQLDRIKGSHHVFKRPGARNIIIPVHHGKVKPNYVRQIKEAIAEEA